MDRLRRAWAWVRAWRATRWAAITFLAQFVPNALKWTQQVYEFYAAGPNSGHQLPGLNTIGYAAAAATTAVGVGVLGFLTDLAAKSPVVPLQPSRPAPDTLPAADTPPPVVEPLLGAVGGGGGIVGGHAVIGRDVGGGFR